MNTVLPPRQVCSFLANEPLYQAQRDRVAALAHEGFDYWDRYQAMRPYLFAGGLLTAAASGWMWYRRGFRHVRKGNSRIAEAHALYPTFLLAGLGVAWVTRPDALFPSAEPSPTDTKGPGFMGWLDNKVRERRAEDPNFADKVFRRLVAAPGVDAIWAETPDHARVFIECGRNRR